MAHLIADAGHSAIAFTFVRYGHLFSLSPGGPFERGLRLRPLWPNAACERVIGTIRREGLDRMLILGRRHLEAVLAEYVEHYNSHRPHRSLDQRAPSTFDSLAPPAPNEEIDLARLRRADRLAGLIHEYRMVA